MSEWYALYTTPRAEKSVHKLLKMDGWECYLPLIRTPRVWTDRVKMIDVPLFKSYIFIKCMASDVYTLVKTKGAVKIVFYNGKPAIIKEEEIAVIRQFILEAEGKRLCTGEEVEILVGSLKNVSGKIMRIRKKFIYLYISQLSATVCVDIGKVASVNRLK